MSKFQRRIRQAELRGVHILPRGNCPDSFYKDHRDKFDIYVESEGMLGPRDLALTKRQAANLAYQISVAKRSKITIEVQATRISPGGRHQLVGARAPGGKAASIGGRGNGPSVCTAAEITNN